MDGKNIFFIFTAFFSVLSSSGSEHVMTKMSSLLVSRLLNRVVLLFISTWNTSLANGDMF